MKTGAEIAKMIENGDAKAASDTLTSQNNVPIFEHHNDKMVWWCTKEHHFDGYVFIFIFRDWELVESEVYRKN